MSNIEIVKGYDITEEHINKLKSIAHSRYSESIYNDYFKNVHNVSDLARLHSFSGYVSENDIVIETLALADDWFMCYKSHEYCMWILEWVALKSYNLKQPMEMLNFFKELLLENKNKTIYGSLRHDTSYALYYKLLKRGYFKEYKNECTVDCASPDEVLFAMKNLRNIYDSIEEFLDSDEVICYKDYLNYILHDIMFNIDESFVKKYSKKTK